MKQNPDSYLLYECGKFITFNIRLKLVMRDEVNPTALNTAAQKAFKRFPYYAKEIRINKAGCIDLIKNDRPLAVTPTQEGHPILGGPEANYHLCSIDYQGDTIYFNMYHGLCGGCGVMFWIKSTLYHYVEECGMNMICGGHYQTETLGVNLVKEKLEKESNIECVFIDLPTKL